MFSSLKNNNAEIFLLFLISNLSFAPVLKSRINKLPLVVPTAIFIVVIFSTAEITSLLTTFRYDLICKLGTIKTPLFKVEIQIVSFLSTILFVMKSFLKITSFNTN